MIYDCFLFNNEMEILEIRLNELSSVVDKFVITESTVTHMNKKKPLYYELNKGKFKKFKSKIIHNVIKDTPDVNNPWIINDYQFSQMIRGLKNAKPDDIVLFGDADEIPKADKVRQWSKKAGKHKVFMQWLAYYYLNYFSTKPYNWAGTHMMKMRDLKKLQSMWIAKYSKVDRYIPEGGWHLSYMGGVKRIQEKISSQAHQEYNTDKYNTPENIIKGIVKGVDFMGQGNVFRMRPLAMLPDYVKENGLQFKELLLDKPNAQQFLIPFLNVKHVLRLKARHIRRRI